MAGSTFITQEPVVAYVTSAASTQVTQQAVTAYLTTSFSTYTTQMTVTAFAVTAFFVQVTQIAVVAWVVDCTSSSYVPPAHTGLIALTATPGATGEQWVDLAWTAVSGFTYTLQRGLSPGAYDTTLLTASTATSYHDAGVSFNVQYYYLVTGINPCSDQTVSQEASASPGCDLPAAPLRLHATANNAAGAIDLIWNAAAGIDTYSVYRGTTSGGETLLVSGLTTTRYSDTTALGGVLYFYSIGSVNDCGVVMGSEASAMLSCCTRYAVDEGECSPYAADADCSTEYAVDGDCSTIYTTDGC